MVKGRCFGAYLRSRSVLRRLSSSVAGSINIYTPRIRILEDVRSRRDTKHGPARYKPTDTRQNHRKTHTNMLTSLNNPYNLFVNIVFQNKQLLQVRYAPQCVRYALDHGSKRLLSRVYFLTFGTYRCSLNCCQGFQRSEVCFPLSRSILLSLSIAGNRQGPLTSTGVPSPPPKRSKPAQGVSWRPMEHMNKTR